MSSAQNTIPILSSISELAGQYDAWLCDIWGVVHNGENPFADAVEACKNFRAGGGVVVLISNSPRPCDAVGHQLAEIGVSESAFDAIVTSGDMTRQVLVERKGQPFFHLGPERDKAIFVGLDVLIVELDESEFVLCSGLYDDLTETPDDYKELFSQMRSRGLQMICANPDLQVERGSRLIYCAGALAAEYEKLGGEVIYTGKPHLPIYDMAVDKVAEAKGSGVPRARILCIGDSIKTDIAGATVAGMDALFVASALHIEGANDDSPLRDEDLENAFSTSAIRPVAAQKSLK
jgi:HAD superfamily hydrolase (TIGR01459 family)